MSVSWYQKRIYEDVFGPVIKGFHIHRITPGYLGGKYVIGNMIALYQDDHVLIHKYRWLKYKDIRDYVAYRMLEEKRGLTSFERSSLGGIISGKFRDSDFQREQGKKGGKKGLGPHVDKVKYAESRRQGGKASAETQKNNPNGAIYKKIICPHCSKLVRQVDYTRWHKGTICLKPKVSSDNF